MKREIDPHVSHGTQHVSPKMLQKISQVENTCCWKKFIMVKECPLKVIQTELGCQTWSPSGNCVKENPQFKIMNEVFTNDHTLNTLKLRPQEMQNTLQLLVMTKCFLECWLLGQTNYTST